MVKYEMYYDFDYGPLKLNILNISYFYRQAVNSVLMISCNPIPIDQMEGAGDEYSTGKPGCQFLSVIR